MEVSGISVLIWVNEPSVKCFDEWVGSSKHNVKRKFKSIVTDIDFKFPVTVLYILSQQVLKNNHIKSHDSSILATHAGLRKARYDMKISSSWH